MAKKKLFEIDKDSIVKATKGGYYYCTTTPEHKYGEKRKDRKKKYIYLHRARLEQKLNRYLKPEEQADHKDGNKENNSPSNLELKVRGPHQKSHAERGNHFWKKSPRNKPGRKAVRSVVAKFVSLELVQCALNAASEEISKALEKESGAIFKEKHIPVKKLTEPKEKTARRVIAKFFDQAELLYKGFTEHPAYKEMPKVFPNYNTSEAEEATEFLMRAFKKDHPLLDEKMFKQMRDKILAGIT